jgi:pilus assembly protein CpaB
MNMRNIILIFAALLVAGGTAFVARGLLTSQPQQQAQVQQEAKAKKVLVAKVDLPTGSFIKPEDLTWQKWPSDGINSVYMLEGQSDMNSVVGAVVRKPIFTGQPVTEAMIARPGDRGFLAAVLTPGMRAMTIGVGNVGAVAGLIFPGDRVDILLTQRMPKFKGDAGELDDADAGKYRPRTTETLFENVRILATNRRLNDIDKEPKDVDNITIEVTPKQAEMLTVVREVGTLTLSLRGLAQPEDEKAAKVATTTPAVEPSTAAAPASAMPAAPEGTNTFVGGAAAATTPTDGKTMPPAVMPEPETPATRGESYTYDVSVSRTLADRVLSGDEEETNKVTVIHASPEGTKKEVIKAQ